MKPARRERLARELAELAALANAQEAVGEIVTVVLPSGRVFRAAVTKLDVQGGGETYWSADLGLTLQVEPW